MSALAARTGSAPYPDEDGLRDHLFSSSFADDQEASTSEKVKSRTRTGTRDQAVNWHLSRCSLDGVGDHRLSTSERFHTTSSDKQKKTAETSKLRTFASAFFAHFL